MPLSNIYWEDGNGSWDVVPTITSQLYYNYDYTESQAEYQEDENNKDSQPSLRFAQEQVEQQQEEQEEQEEQQEGDNITEQGSDAAITIVS